ncbi:MAG TPA: hypothetical protein VHV47_00005, partial [Opitutaceae bacterium]|nr:hypothetical protein [Opitutaceae bacterium]
APEAAAAAQAETSAAAPPPAAPAFDSVEEAKAHLLAQARDRVVRTVTQARFHGRLLGNLPEGEIHRAVEGEWERQKRFPLDTANGLRGRLRREHFTIFKKGSKGVSYVCAVKRKFRVPGQAFAESIGGLISFIETNPLVKAGELPAKILDLPAPPAAGAEAPALTPEQREKAAKLYGDLRWLVGEGYVTEFIDGALYAPPAMVESCKKEIESEEQDPENFPEAPPPEADLPAPEPPAEAPVPAAEAPPEAPAEAAPAAEPSAEPPAS